MRIFHAVTNKSRALISFVVTLINANFTQINVAVTCTNSNNSRCYRWWYSWASLTKYFISGSPQNRCFHWSIVWMTHFDEYQLTTPKPQSRTHMMYKTPRILSAQHCPTPTVVRMLVWQISIRDTIPPHIVVTKMDINTGVFSCRVVCTWLSYLGTLFLQTRFSAITTMVHHVSRTPTLPNTLYALLGGYWKRFWSIDVERFLKFGLKVYTYV